MRYTRQAIVTTIAGIIAVTLLPAAPAEAAQPVPPPPTIIQPTCSHREEAGYTIPSAPGGVYYEASINKPGQYGAYRGPLYPGVYFALSDTFVSVVAYTYENLEVAGSPRVMLGSWSLYFDQPTGCPVKGQVSARVVGRCKSWTVDLRTRATESWQIAAPVEVQVEVDGRLIRQESLSSATTTAVTRLPGHFARKRPHTVAVYVEGALAAERRFPCGSRR